MVCTAAPKDNTRSPTICGWRQKLTVRHITPTVRNESTVTVRENILFFEMKQPDAQKLCMYIKSWRFEAFEARAINQQM